MFRRDDLSILSSPSSSSSSSGYRCLLLLVVLTIISQSIDIVNGFSSTTTSTTTRIWNIHERISSPVSRDSIKVNSNTNNVIQLRSSNDSDNSSTTATTSQPRTSTAGKDNDDNDDGIEFYQYEGKRSSEDWELDCYSRPVITEGRKKLWEVLITDSTGSFRFCKTLPSNMVNSKEVRQTVEELMEDPRIETKPSTIRFFRGAMFNMINIALNELDVVGRPSRCTYSIAQWLEERHKDVYPKMEGYRSTMGVGLGGAGGGAGGVPSFLDVRTPVKMPDSLRGEKYAFVALPLAEFLPGGDISEDNIGVGRLCTISDRFLEDLPPADTFVQGVVILTQRPDALAAWLAGTEVSSMSCDLRKRNLIMDTNIDTRFLMARLNDDQRQEGIAFEEGKDTLNGLHFVCVQRDEDDEPAGFWLMRELPAGI